MKKMENNLKAVRTKKAISQLELARITKIAPANICNIENGKQYPYLGWRRRKAKALNVEEKEIFFNEEV